MFNLFTTSRINKSKPAHLMLLASMLLVLVPHLLRVPLWLSLFCISLIGWRLYVELTGSRLPHLFIKLLLITIAVVGILMSYQTVVGRYAGSAVLLVMFCLKLTEFKTERDAFVIIFLGYFIVITGFLFSQSIPVALYMLLVTLALTTSLIAFQHPAVLSSQAQHAKLATRMLLYSLPLAIILFMFFPRTSGPLWGLPEDAHSATSGLSSQMSPGRISRLTESSAIAFRVQFDNQIPPPETRYWRGPVFWHYDGTSWSSVGKAPHLTSDYHAQALTTPTAYSVTLQPHNKKWLFTLDAPVSTPTGAQFNADYLLLSQKPVTQIKRYSLTSATQFQLEGYQLLGLTRYLQLPADTSPKTRQLVSSWRDQGLNDSAIVEQALAYFAQQEFYYSRTPPLLFDDPVDEFLFKTREGYCEHYASAFTVMMRSANIPARVVTGYFGGELNPLGDYLIVRQSDAHAWSEVYLADRGWLRIDPTSVIPPQRIKNTSDIVRIQPRSERAASIIKDSSWLYRSYKTMANVLDSINNRWNQWVIGYNNRKQIALFEAFGVPEISWRGLTAVMFGLLALLVAAFSYTILKHRTRPDPLGRVYARFCAKMKKHGFTKRVNETPHEFSRRIAAEIPRLRPALMKIAASYTALRYGKYYSQARLRALADQIESLKL
ncbi:MAG: DUF3488 and transglutaminase-like domain-containing protein [Thioalkalispiraceae bacterium]|jgi:transglutaminase-like putative cysteine protease